MITSSAAQPRSYVFDAYNVGWSLGDKMKTPEVLGKELVDLWHHHKFHAIGLSEIYEIEYKDEAVSAEVQEDQGVAGSHRSRQVDQGVD